MTRSPTIQEAVTRSLEKYFQELAGSQPGLIYDMVLSAVEKPMLEVVMKKAEGNQLKASATGSGSATDSDSATDSGSGSGSARGSRSERGSARVTGSPLALATESVSARRPAKASASGPA